MDGFLGEFDKFVLELAQEHKMVFDAAQSIANLQPLGPAPAPVSPDKPPRSPGSASATVARRGVALAAVVEPYSVFNTQLAHRIRTETYGHVLGWLREQYAGVVCFDGSELHALRNSDPKMMQLYERVHMLRCAFDYANLVDLFEGSPALRDEVMVEAVKFGRTVIVDYLVKYCNVDRPVAVPLLV